MVQECCLRERDMRKLTMVLCSAVVLWLAIPTAFAQNTVDVLGGGPQPTNTFGCSPAGDHCIRAPFDTSSNKPTGGDIPAPIKPNGVQFYYAGGAQIPVVSPAAAGTICLADSRLFTGLFADEVANCKAGGTAVNPVLAVLIIRDSAVLTEGVTVPVFQIS